MTARQRFGGVFRRNDRDRDGGGRNHDSFKNARHGREAAAPRATFTKDVTKDYGKGKMKDALFNLLTISMNKSKKGMNALLELVWISEPWQS
eukprot:jgi/Tetstr1/423314/TSEL_014012.t1